MKVSEEGPLSRQFSGCIMVDACLSRSQGVFLNFVVVNFTFVNCVFVMEHLPLASPHVPVRKKASVPSHIHPELNS